jgi:hypothetical protein
MKHSKEIAELLERIELLEAQLAPKPQAPPERTTANVMREMFGVETDHRGAHVATAEQIAAHQAHEKEKANTADRASAYAQKWARENGVGFSGPSASPEAIAAVMEAQRREHHDAVTSQNSYRQDPHDE